MHCENCLVILYVARVRRPPPRDIGRQRHLAGTRYCRVERGACDVEHDFSFAGILCANLGGEAVELQSVPGAQFARGPRERQKTVGCGAPVQQQFDRRTILTRDNFLPMQPRRDNLAVVDDEHITLAKKFRQIADLRVCERSVFADDEHARGIARRRRPERNPLLRQLVIEQRYVHACKLKARTGGEENQKKIVISAKSPGLTGGEPRRAEREERYGYHGVLL